MSIELDETQLLLVLDEAIALARSNAELPALWLRRVERLGELGVKTYIAALGGALLAKATNPRVDSFTQDPAAGPGGYSLRKAAEFLARNNHGRFHMGAKGPNPMNNRPFLGGPGRIDEFTKIKIGARPSYELFCDCLRDLNRGDSALHAAALAAWVRIRMRVIEEERAESARIRSLTAGVNASDLVAIAERFIRADSEGGRRAQAFAAAILDCAHQDVQLQAINNPKHGDVRLRIGGDLRMVVEAKSDTCDESTALTLAEEAAGLGATLALLVVIADRHRPMDREMVRRQALERHGVFVEITESARELIGVVAVITGTPAHHILATLPGAYAQRMGEHGVRPSSVEHWTQLIEARS